MDEEQIAIDKKHIPLDKSWIIRMGVLDTVNGYNDIQKFLSEQQDLSEDLLALKRAAVDWKSDKPIDVGESGTLYRLLKFASWKLGLHKEFITQGTLAERSITNDSKIVHFSQTELLALDNGTSQWATAAVLIGDKERLPAPPFKLQMTYESVDHWKQRRKINKTWVPRYDATILDQAWAYLELLNGRKVEFISKQAEDFCFAFAFGYMTAEEGGKRWPSLYGHESNRIIEMQKMLDAAESGKEIISKDHRVVQAIAMWGKVNNKKISFIHPSVVNKSWPQFWDFLNSQKLTSC